MDKLSVPQRFAVGLFFGGEGVRRQERLERSIRFAESILKEAEERKKHFKILKLKRRIFDLQLQLKEFLAPREKLTVKAEKRSAEYFDLFSERGFRADPTRLHRVTRGQADRNYYGYSE